MKRFWPDLIKNRMPFFKNNFIYSVLFFLCILIASIYRFRYYWLFPPIYDTFDELAMVWQGQSLFKTGIPTSWSYHPYYAKGIPPKANLALKDFAISVDGVKPNKDNYSGFPKPVLLTQEVEIDGYKSYFNFVSPDLEQPPLGGLIIAAPLIKSSINAFSTNIKEFRKPFIFYGVIACALVIILADLLYGRGVSLVSGLLYATVPTIVVGSRLALPENILVILILSELILLELYRKSKKLIYFYGVLAIVFISPLVKFFGLAIVMIGIIYFLTVKKDLNKALSIFLSGVLSVLVYFIYGLSIDKNTFFWGLSYQSQRFFAGPIVFLVKLLIPKITKIFLDGWIIFGWLAIVAISLKEKFSKHAPLLIGLFSYLFVLIIFGGEDYGWYRIPIYPFLIIASGVIIFEIIKKASFLPSVLLLFTGFASSFYWGLGIFNWTPYLMIFRLGVMFFVFILSLKMLFKKNWTLRLASIMLLLVFLISIFLNTRTINNLNSIWPKLGEKSSLILERP